MKDNKTTFNELKNIVKEFVKEREWEQFHSPKNLAMSISIEAAELMEHFQWVSTKQSIQLQQDPEVMSEIRDELADILTYCFNMANVMDIDIAGAMKEKMEKNKKKYPIEKAKGISKKYNKL